jgi:hypothetical protein
MREEKRGGGRDVVEIESKKMGVLEMKRRRCIWGCAVVDLLVLMPTSASWEMGWKDGDGGR